MATENPTLSVEERDLSNLWGHKLNQRLNEIIKIQAEQVQQGIRPGPIKGVFSEHQYERWNREVWLPYLEIRGLNFDDLTEIPGRTLSTNPIAPENKRKTTLRRYGVTFASDLEK